MEGNPGRSTLPNRLRTGRQLCLVQHTGHRDLVQLTPRILTSGIPLALTEYVYLGTRIDSSLSRHREVWPRLSVLSIEVYSCLTG